MKTMTKSHSSIIKFQDIRLQHLPTVGAKAFQLAAMRGIDDILVPDGFCISTTVFDELIGKDPLLVSQVNELRMLSLNDENRIAELGMQIRSAIESIAIPAHVMDAIASEINRFPPGTSFAVRSSATAEDLPHASFAGQQDSFLHIEGIECLSRSIRKCWASLFTYRAIIYRLQNEHANVRLSIAVIIQQMIFAEASGILFTADPVSGHRKILSIDAGFGLGEALVSGLVSADNYKVRDRQILEKNISSKKLAIYPAANGGTIQQELPAATRALQVLTDSQIISLAKIGRSVEAFFHKPQDIEWCLYKQQFYIVQSRAITTLFPVPLPAEQGNRVYVSVGHQQMMTDAMKPLGLSFFQMTAPRPMPSSAGRLFVDVTAGIASAASRQNLLDVLGQSHPLMKDALISILERGDFIQAEPADISSFNSIKSSKGLSAEEILLQASRCTITVEEMIRQLQAPVETTANEIVHRQGVQLFDYIAENVQQRRKIVADPQGLALLMNGLHAYYWLNEKMNEWLGEKNVADILSQSAPDNITAEMGLALLDVADAIRPFPSVISYLENMQDDEFWEALEKLEGGKVAAASIKAFLHKYGMRCHAEIDITRPRWAEKPAMLVPMILTNIRNQLPGASRKKFEQGLQEANNKKAEILQRLSDLPDATRKISDTEKMIDLLRSHIGYREYPKYSIVSRYLLYKKALMKEADRLANAGIIHHREDVFYLSFDEFRQVVATQTADMDLIAQRKEEYHFFEKLIPPRVITSDGEIVTGNYQRGNTPENAIVGMAVSAGIIEGRARIVLTPDDATLENGDILITTFTDPSWTPLFVSIKGLVTEVGGLMTHGAVIAREYGLPAIAGVDNATRLIRDGQRIRLNGTEGYIEILGAD